MLLKNIPHKLLKVFLLFIVCSAVLAEEFVVQDIRVQGLQRLTPGTVFNYLPIEAGEKFNDQVSIEAVRALFKTGFFDDVRLERDGNVLVVIVKERPTIGSVSIEGNKDIKTEELMKGLKQSGFAEGRVFDQSQLDKLEQELQRQYFSAGKYAVKIKSKITPMDNNRVGVAIDISEGKAARIKQINIVGNQSYPEDELRDAFELTPPTLFSFFTKSDQYSREKLSGDLETLRSHYLDHGYVNFSIDSTQVSLTPDKKDIYITINITEGDQYTVSGVKLAGELIVPEEELFPLISVQNGGLFSRKDITDSSTRITDRLGSDGYAFANVNSIPDIDEEAKTVGLTFFVDPGKRVYVQRVMFTGNTRTRDEVLRREMRQQEAGWIATPQVERGKVRLQRLGYFKEVNVETPAVAGSADQVDVNYTVEEKPFGNFLAGIGFSQSQGLIFQTSITQDNFLGSGARVQFAFNNSEINRRISVGYMNPYYTIDGISRGFNLNYQDTDYEDFGSLDYDSRVWGGGVNFGIPISEYNFIFTSLNYENTEISPDRFSSYLRRFIDKYDDHFNILRLGVSYSYDTRNKAILPESGVMHQIGSETGIPSFGTSLEFTKVSYKLQWFHPLWRDFIFAARGEVGYGLGLFDTDELPVFENFYAGGPRSVRGFEENRLGPQDLNGRPFGGNIEMTGGAEIILPVPFLKDLDSVRIAGFVDVGNVFISDCSDYKDLFVTRPEMAQCERSEFDLNELRYSVGLSGIWISPFGLISVSIAAPFGDDDTDETQPFQFTFGTNF
ncbi:MAG: outer membrane protein assembly factor BamA [Gammaproteobacteria bacterium RIFCSPLOWO2_02_FULL_61_13]|nr:MAG: outer membrane protein assembly factor BamA [Gammaproteobacteria bacterium RIFCSPLOWO2_02_FULL_61_13]